MNWLPKALWFLRASRYWISVTLVQPIGASKPVRRRVFDSSYGAATFEPLHREQEPMGLEARDPHVLDRTVGALKDVAPVHLGGGAALGTGREVHGTELRQPGHGRLAGA